MSDKFSGQAWFEYLFWGPGHTIQFAYTQLMLLAWLWMADATRVRPLFGGPVLLIILALGAAPVLLVPYIHLSYAVTSAESRIAFTQLMQWGGGVAAIPIGLALLFPLLRAGRPEPGERPVRRALMASMLLFAAGGLIGVFIGGVNTIIPAHYHGSIVGVTLALMGLTYHLLPSLGYTTPLGKMAAIQPLVYAAGQLLHVGGLAVSGAMGIQRKTAGAEQGLDNLPRILSMGVMGLGGLLAVIGGVLFVVVVFRVVWRR
jgi:heme/copper-type cytochrome/quinol oxidase subunit 1